MSRAEVISHRKKVRITLDISESLVKDIDEIRKQLGVDCGALMKVWLHEKVKQEKERQRAKSQKSLAGRGQARNVSIS